MFKLKGSFSKPLIGHFLLLVCVLMSVVLWVVLLFVMVLHLPGSIFFILYIVKVLTIVVLSSCFSARLDVRVSGLLLRMVAIMME